LRLPQLYGSDEGEPMKFEPANPYAKLGGQARRGTRNKFDTFVYACVLAHLQHKVGEPPPAEYARTHLWTSLEITRKERPHEYWRNANSMLIRQVSFENETDLAKTDQLIEAIRAELAAREVRALEAPKIKVIEHAVN
jgi:hypothetical protein